MKIQIGFSAEDSKNDDIVQSYPADIDTTAPRKSVVQVHFPTRNMTLAYYNDRFDLHRGDFVFVDGKLEGLRGRVVDVTYHFKIKLSEYKRVIAVVDTNVAGTFYLADSHLVAFDKDHLPYEKAMTWFFPPEQDDEEYVSGDDDAKFHLDHLDDMDIRAIIAERGHDYYLSNKVVYISVDETGKGRAIVEGTKPYSVEFDYENDWISNLTCTCFCSYHCKHEFAAMLQLKETLNLITKHYGDLYEAHGYFAAISKAVFMSFALDGKECSSFTLN